MSQTSAFTIQALLQGSKYACITLNTMMAVGDHSAQGDVPLWTGIFTVFQEGCKAYPSYFFLLLSRSEITILESLNVLNISPLKKLAESTLIWLRRYWGKWQQTFSYFGELIVSFCFLHWMTVSYSINGLLGAFICCCPYMTAPHPLSILPKSEQTGRWVSERH